MMNYFVLKEIYAQFAQIGKHKSQEEECQNRVKLHVMVAKLGLDTITCHYREELQAVYCMFSPWRIAEIMRYFVEIQLPDIFKINDIGLEKNNQVSTHD